MDGALVLDFLFWPLAVLGTHFLYVRKRHHPAWTPWKATAAFLWHLAWPTVLVLAVVVAGVFLIGGENAPGLTAGLAPVIALGALFPIFRRAKRIILAPPGHIGPMREGEAEGWERAAEERLERDRALRRERGAHRAERLGTALGRAVGRLLGLRR
ncbi:MAG: hypothetical protein HQL36_01895 [Alphaproteobacteria bacterium]|nr:hypothetical protein [Alphaproteobacteria bacterium]